MPARSWIGSGGTIYSAGGRPIPGAAQAPLSTLGRMLAARLREPARRPAPEADPSDALARERLRQTEALRATPEGALLAALAREAAADALEREALDLAVATTRERVEILERQRDREFRCPPTYRRQAELYRLEHAIPRARAELADAIAQRDRAEGLRLRRAEIRRACEPRP